MKTNFLQKKFIEILSISTLDEQAKKSITNSFNEKTNEFDQMCIIKQIECNYTSL